MLWDYKDELKEVDLGGGGTAYYVYDAGGERVRKVIEKTGGIIEERVYLGGFEIFRKTVSGTLQFERETLHVSDDQKKIVSIETKTKENTTSIQNPVPSIRYQYDNHLGSAALELDDTAAIISYEEYHPFGTTSYRSGRTETEVSLKRYKYVGKERDEETGLYYYGARYYAAWLCRFVSVDPLQFKYPYYTPFQYAGNKPISYIDLDGLEEKTIQYNEESQKGSNTGLQVNGDISQALIDIKSIINDKKLESKIELDGNKVIFNISDSEIALIDNMDAKLIWEMVNSDCKMLYEVSNQSFDLGEDRLKFETGVKSGSDIGPQKTINYQEKIKVKYRDADGNKVKWKDTVDKVYDHYSPSKEGFDSFRQVINSDYEFLELDPSTDKTTVKPRASIVRHELFEMYKMTAEGLEYIKAHDQAIQYQKINANDKSKNPGVSKGIRQKNH